MVMGKFESSFCMLDSDSFYVFQAAGSFESDVMDELAKRFHNGKKSNRIRFLQRIYL